MVVTAVKTENSTTIHVYLKSGRYQRAAYFNAGQYLPIFVEIDGNTVERPYAISSSPEEEIQGFYQITIKKANDGYISNYICSNWQVGTLVIIGSLDGFEYYHPLRDSQQIIALAGGVGVTPFHAMAKAIINGTIDCQLTQIYGAKTFEEVMFSQEWEALKEASKGKFNYAIVLAKEERNNTEYGFITVDLIEKYQQIEGASSFICGPNGMLQYIKSILVPLNLQKKLVRYGIGRGFTVCTGRSACGYGLPHHGTSGR